MLQGHGLPVGREVGPAARTVCEVGVEGGALLTARREDFASAGDLYGAVEFLYLPGFGYLAAFGAGLLSLDEILVRRFVPSGEPQQAVEGLNEVICGRCTP